MKNVKKAIIPAAGYGTRNLPITKVLPKEMFPINGKPAIHYIVEEAMEAGIEELLIVVSRNKNLILDYFDRSLEFEAFLEKANKQYLLDEISIPSIHIQYVRQPFAEGLGDAIKLGKSFVGEEPFAVLLPDEIFLCDNNGALSQLIESFHLFEEAVIGLQEVRPAFLKSYGVIKEEIIDKRHYKVVDIVEKPQNSPPSNLAVIGRYVFKPSLFTYLDSLEKGVGGEIQLTDAIKKLLSSEECYGVNIEGNRYDVGKDIDYFRLLERLFQIERRYL